MSKWHACDTRVCCLCRSKFEPSDLDNRPENQCMVSVCVNVCVCVCVSCMQCVYPFLAYPLQNFWDGDINFHIEVIPFLVHQRFQWLVIVKCDEASLIYLQMTVVCVCVCECVCECVWVGM